MYLQKGLFDVYVPLAGDDELENLIHDASAVKISRSRIVKWGESFMKEYIHTNNPDILEAQDLRFAHLS